VLKYLCFIFLCPFVLYGQKSVYQLIDSTDNLALSSDSLVNKIYVEPLLKNLALCKTDTCKLLNFRYLFYVYIDNGNTLKSHSYADSILKYADKYIAKQIQIKQYELEKAKVYDELARFLMRRDYSLTLDYNNKARIIFEKYNEVYKICGVLSNYGSVYIDLRQFDNALVYLSKEKKLIQKQLLLDSTAVKFRILLAQNLGNLAIIYIGQEKFELAKNVLIEQLSIYTKFKSNEKMIFAYLNLASLNRKRKDFKSAHLNVEKALKILSNKNYKQLLSPAYLIKAKIFDAEGDLVNSLLNIKLAEQIAKGSITISLRDIYELRAYLSEKTKNYKDAAKYYKLLNDVNDTVYKKTDIEKAFEFKERYESQKSENEIVKLAALNDIMVLEQGNESKTKHLLIVLSIAAGIVSLLFLFLFIVVNRTRKRAAKTNVKLNIQSAQIMKYQIQMNPHFIFNAMSNLQILLIKNKLDRASTLLNLFAELMQNTFRNSDLEHISLTEEVNYINTYYQFETSKIEYHVDFKINMDESLKKHTVFTLPMLIQPFIENCFIHAGFDSIENPLIILNIKQQQDRFLEVKIIDNGIGLKEAANHVEDNGHEYQSKALSITTKRIVLWYEKYKLLAPNYFSMINNRDLDENSSGVTISLLLPLIK
jgi:Histidine kinase